MLNKIYYFNSNDNYCGYFLSRKLTELINDYRDTYNGIVILCIGSDRSTGDSLGPLVGYKLQSKHLFNTVVYGSLQNPVHALNIDNIMDEIYIKHPGSLVIAIDASTGKKNHIGYITLTKGPLRPGLAVCKDLKPIGHICITGIVNIQSVMNHMILQTTRLGTVMNLADSISNAVFNACKTINYSQ